MLRNREKLFDFAMNFHYERYSQFVATTMPWFIIAFGAIAFLSTVWRAF